jgi:hypothetical protein
MSICYKCTHFASAGNESFCDEKNEYCPETHDGGQDLEECKLFTAVTKTLRVPFCDLSRTEDVKFKVLLEDYGNEVTLGEESVSGIGILRINSGDLPKLIKVLQSALGA